MTILVNATQPATKPIVLTPLPTAEPVWDAGISTRRKIVDRVATVLMCASFIAVIVPLVSVLWTVTSNGWPAFSAEFFTHSMRNVVGPGGGIYHALIGTTLMTAGAAAISIPIGLLTAIYLVEYGNGGRLSRSVTFFVDIMTGIPSIVAGLFAYAVLAAVFGPGIRMGIGGSLALSLLMIPTVVRSSEEMLRLVPHELREAAYALGVPQWRMIVKVVVPTAFAGLITGITLAIARVIGETAPLLLIAGATASTNFNLFDGRMASLPVFAFSEQSSPGMFADAAMARAWGAALVLVILVMALNLIARLISALFSPRKD